MRALLVVCALASLAQAAPTEKLLERVLGGIEKSPSAEGVKLLGAGADQALIDVANDAHTSRARRLRAILALRHVPTSTARLFLYDVIRENEDALELAHALTALAPHGAAVAPAILPYLTHASADVRQAAAAALARTGAPEAAAALRIRLVAERDPGVRAVVLQAARLLEK